MSGSNQAEGVAVRAITPSTARLNDTSASAQGATASESGMNWDRMLPPRPAASKGSTQVRGRAKPMKAIANRNNR